MALGTQPWPSGQWPRAQRYIIKAMCDTAALVSHPDFGSISETKYYLDKTIGKLLCFRFFSGIRLATIYRRLNRIIGVKIK